MSVDGSSRGTSPVLDVESRDLSQRRLRSLRVEATSPSLDEKGLEQSRTPQRDVVVKPDGAARLRALMPTKPSRDSPKFENDAAKFRSRAERLRQHRKFGATLPIMSSNRHEEGTKQRSHHRRLNPFSNAGSKDRSKDRSSRKKRSSRKDRGERSSSSADHEGRPGNREDSDVRNRRADSARHLDKAPGQDPPPRHRHTVVSTSHANSQHNAFFASIFGKSRRKHTRSASEEERKAAAMTHEGNVDARHEHDAAYDSDSSSDSVSLKLVDNKAFNLDMRRLTSKVRLVPLRPVPEASTLFQDGLSFLQQSEAAVPTCLFASASCFNNVRDLTFGKDMDAEMKFCYFEVFLASQARHGSVTVGLSPHQLSDNDSFKHDKRAVYFCSNGSGRVNTPCTTPLWGSFDTIGCGAKRAKGTTIVFLTRGGEIIFESILLDRHQPEQFFPFVFFDVDSTHRPAGQLTIASFNFGTASFRFDLRSFLQDISVSLVNQPPVYSRSAPALAPSHSNFTLLEYRMESRIGASKVLADGLTVTYNKRTGQSEWGTHRSNRPLDQVLPYFEVLLLANDEADPVCFGLALKSYPVASRLGRPGSYCFSGRGTVDGAPMMQQTSTSAAAPDHVDNLQTGVTFSTGDIVGCGIYEEAPYGRFIYFTKNGKYLGVQFLVQDSEVELYPAVSLGAPGTYVFVNLDARPFLFNFKNNYITDMPSALRPNRHRKGMLPPLDPPRDRDDSIETPEPVLSDKHYSPTSMLPSHLPPRHSSPHDKLRARRSPLRLSPALSPNTNSQLPPLPLSQSPKRRTAPLIQSKSPTNPMISPSNSILISSAPSPPVSPRVAPVARFSPRNKRLPLSHSNAARRHVVSSKQVAQGLPGSKSSPVISAQMRARAAEVQQRLPPSLRIAERQDDADSVLSDAESDRESVMLHRSQQRARTEVSDFEDQEPEPQRLLLKPKRSTAPSFTYSPKHSIQGQLQHSRSSPDNKSQEETFDWQKGDMLGEGAFGKVYLGLDGSTGELFAAKQIRISNSSSPETARRIEQIQREINMLRALEHKHIVRYLGIQLEKDPEHPNDPDYKCLYIFLEYASGGSIQALVKKFGPLSEAIIRRYTKQILLGLEYLHQKRVIHRDIKGANVLVDNRAIIKLADFGASKEATDSNSKTKSTLGTPFYMAPEVIRGEKYDTRADIWSVGCTLIEMATASPPWSHLNPVSAMYAIATSNQLPLIPENLSPICQDFIRSCLQRNPADRPSAAQLLQHPFICKDGASPSAFPQPSITPSNSP